MSPTAFGLGSSRAFGIAKSIVTAITEPYWISTINDVNILGNNFDICVDSSGNVYGCNTAANSFIIFKYNKNGTIQWQKSLTGVDSYGFSVDVDSSGNVYACGQITSGAGDFLIVKYDTNGNLLWQRSLGGSSADLGNRLVVDTSGNIYVAAQTESQGAGNRDLLILKYNTSGSLLWQRVLGGAIIDTATDISIDSSGNCYVVGSIDSSASGVIVKYNTNGTLVWQRSLIGNTNQLRGIAVDSSGNSYAVGVLDTGAQYDMLIVKYDTNGNLQWQKSLGSSSLFDSSYNICLDNLGYFYIAGTSVDQSANPTPIGNIIAKYDTNGNLQWQRSFRNTFFDYIFNPWIQQEGYGIDVDGNNNLYFAGWRLESDFSNTLYITRVPGDGSKTGTYTGAYAYGDFIYEVSTLPTGTPSLTSSTSTLTSSTSTLTSSTSTLTSSTTSFTSATKQIT
jgi:hypothetical protein